MADTRRRPTAGTRARLLSEQSYRCLYCTLPFGSVVRRHTRQELTRLEWDHVVPYALAGRNPDSNWAAACNVCNAIKSDHVYDDVIQARNDILARWNERRIVALWIPSVSSEDDLDAWGVEYTNRSDATDTQLPEDPPPPRAKFGLATCRGCGEDFEVRRSVQGSCSDRCGQLVHARQMRAERVIIEQAAEELAPILRDLVREVVEAEYAAAGRAES